MKQFRMIALMSIALAGASAGAADWTPTSASLLTRWGKEVTPENAWQDYPRPQMAREKWQNLNGLWDLAIDSNAISETPNFDHKILVPYPVESSLSGVGKRATHLMYKRTFQVPADWKGERVLLHFDACDWQTSVSVNGKVVKSLDGEEVHQGGYDRFSYDITDALKDGADQEVTVSVFDPTEKGDQPRGKQVTNPHGIWYTPTTGIWQTVWMEPVSNKGYVRSVKFTPDPKTGKVKVRVDAPDAKDGVAATVNIRLQNTKSGKVRRESPNAEIEYEVKEYTSNSEEPPVLWSPENPFLYWTEVDLYDGDIKIDSILTYFAFRDIEIKKVGQFQRIFLNGKEIFQTGTLDQGFWPDGLYTPPSAKALSWDIDYTREMGFNMIRKHIKVEPDIWYHHCDKTGMLVWQDAVNGVMKSEESHRQFEKDMHRMIDGHWNSPAIVLWVIFNEGWGQYDTERLTAEVKTKDPSRIVTNPSGWVDVGVGDTKDMHKYPGPGAPDPEDDRASVLGEFGGLGLLIEGHAWAKKTWGYQGMRDREELFERFAGIMNGLKFLRATYGLNASVYTQTTDVEIEANGLVTYDREIQKMDTGKIRAINESIINMGELRVLASTALVTTATGATAPEWQYTTAKPVDDWTTADSAAGEWKTAQGGFGSTTKRIFGPVNTEWKSPDIWVRRSFELPADVNVDNVELIAAYVDEAEFYINGVKAAEFKEFVTGYKPIALTAEAKAALKPGGKNVIAIHCHDKGEQDENKDIGQYIDAGLIETTPAK